MFTLLPPLRLLRRRSGLRDHPPSLAAQLDLDSQHAEVFSRTLQESLAQSTNQFPAVFRKDSPRSRAHLLRIIAFNTI